MVLQRLSLIEHVFVLRLLELKVLFLERSLLATLRSLDLASTLHNCGSRSRQHKALVAIGDVIVVQVLGVVLVHLLAGSVLR